MREHMGLYRGKRIDNGEWVEGNLIVFRRNVDDEYWCIVRMPTGYGAFEAYKFTYEVDPETVGECTGLRDKNDKLIFEGDILRLDGDDLPHWLDRGQKRKVKYDLGGFDPLCEYDSNRGAYVVAEYCEIIGNIYDNPEIWEGKQ